MHRVSEAAREPGASGLPSYLYRSTGRRWRCGGSADARRGPDRDARANACHSALPSSIIGEAGYGPRPRRYCTLCLQTATPVANNLFSHRHARVLVLLPLSQPDVLRRMVAP